MDNNETQFRSKFALRPDSYFAKRYGNAPRGGGPAPRQPQTQSRAPNGGRPRQGFPQAAAPRFTSGFSRDAAAERSTEPSARLERELFEEHDEATKGIDFGEYESVKVEVSGGAAPAPIETFEDVENIHPQLLWNIERSGYTGPTPVQKHAFPIAVSGTDIMAVAQTGSGKTAAFLLPMVQMLLETGGGSRSAFFEGTNALAPIGLILTPTRELAVQIHSHARKFLYRTGMRAGVAYGGTPTRAQLTSLRAGVDILVATPGRLCDFLERGAITLRGLRFFVLDEADRMLDMGFEKQLLQILSPQHGAAPPGQRQTLMFSATFPPEIQRLARKFLGAHLFIAVGRVGGAAKSVRQELVYSESGEKNEILLDFFRSVGEASVLVFVERKMEAAWLERFLCNHSVDAISIHGDKEQREREYAINCFKKGLVKVLVATDVASRGLDIPNVAYVVNYDMSNSIDDYIHRIGRTGRIGNKGVALTIISERDGSKILQDLRKQLVESNQVVPEWMPDIIAKRGNDRSGDMRRGGRRFGARGGRGMAQTRRGNW